MATAVPTLRIGLTPDPDDAFLLYGIAHGLVTLPGHRLELVLADIQSLNQRAVAQGDLEVTALSAAVYPQVAHRYQIAATGTALSQGPGPVLIGRAPLDLEALAGQTIAIPGPDTTAFLLLRLRLGPLAATLTFRPLPHTAILPAVQQGTVAAGLLIHAGPLVYQSAGLTSLCDLGHWWQAETGLPIPLGVTAVRRDLPSALARSLVRRLRQSLETALAHETAALAYARTFAPDLDPATIDRFIRQVVTPDTLDLSPIGEQALTTLYHRAHQAGLLSTLPPVDLLRP